MPSSKVETFTDLDAYHAAIRETQPEGVVTASGTFGAELTSIKFDRLSLYRSEESLPRVAYTALDPKLFVVVFSISPGPPGSVHGLGLSSGDIIVFRAGSTGHNRTLAPCKWGGIALRHEAIAEAGRALTGRELIAPPLTQVIKPPPHLLSRLLGLHEAAGHLAKASPDILAQPEPGRAMELALAEAMVACLESSDPVIERSAYRVHAKIMRRFEEALQANLEGPLFITELCSAVGVSHSTLRICCRERLGMGPKRYLLLRRMHLAHRALLSAGPEQTTVTDTATNYGFWELGRFAVTYHSLFGESPSATLRRPPENSKPGDKGESWSRFTKIA